MRRILIAIGLVAAVAACNNSTEPAKKDPAIDPYITIRVLNQLDTTTRPGRAFWTLYALLSGPVARQNGISYQGNFSMTDARFNHRRSCMAAGSDSIGQRLIAPWAIADTTKETWPGEGFVDSIAKRWNEGNHAPPPAGFMILTIDPIDAWDSQQFRDGRGRVMSDPIKWAWTWTGRGTHTFTERIPSDTAGCNVS